MDVNVNEGVGYRGMVMLQPCNLEWLASTESHHHTYDVGNPKMERNNCYRLGIHRLMKLKNEWIRDLLYSSTQIIFSVRRPRDT